ncbi:hypothetical protein DSO57_1002712 [Entomophthora muscae]|uniref:Uncharacterized protein n=1 Tax=Entomophthora muscae TaxID=34485 RepID=A0ACC2UTG0_9FUNG|nr:hypothetical protein DSO57_1002712 [Entomophthora muscae]
MHHLIFTAVLTACLGIGGYQPGSEFFGPSTEGLGYDPYHNPGQLNSSNTGPWLPLVSPYLTLSIAIYTSAYYILTYFAGSFGHFNIHAKVFCWLMMVYPIVTALTGFQFTNLLPYILQVVPTISGYYNRTVRNDNLDAPKSQNTEPESNPGQNILRTARPIGWEHENPLLIKEVATSLPGPEPLAVPQDSASKPPVQDAKNFPKVPTPDTNGLPNEIDRSPPRNYSKLSQSHR